MVAPDPDFRRLGDARIFIDRTASRGKVYGPDPREDIALVDAHYAARPCKRPGRKAKAV